MHLKLIFTVQNFDWWGGVLPFGSYQLSRWDISSPLISLSVHHGWVSAAGEGEVEVEGGGGGTSWKPTRRRQSYLSNELLMVILLLLFC